MIRATIKNLSTLLALSLTSLIPNLASAQTLSSAPYIQTTATPNSFPLVQNSAAATLYIDANDFPGVTRAATDLQTDIATVTTRTPPLTHDEKSLAKNAIFIGTLGKSPLIDRLIREKKLDVSAITGKWESYITQTIANPLPGVDSALVIAGSDKRGTIYGIYDLSEQIGVSPWHYWADVPTPHHDALFVKSGRYLHGEPSVKYRGIFFNDESPDLSNWVREKFGSVTPDKNPKVAGQRAAPANYGHEFYTKVFELLLRLHGNYMWPAMWNNAFNEDDPENARLADEYGIVMGTSHQEPMLRAQKEWDWGEGKQAGNWNYNNAAQRPTLEKFWRDGVTRNKNYESIFTMGLRAENDSGQAIGADLTAQIVDVQRKILADVINPDVTKVPQAWCLYKEVQGYYEAGLRVPDDITLLWAEDNWGNVRRLPTAEERKRSGGAGIYYHFDYHGGPRSYQWINTSPLPKIWDQMSLAKQYGADRIWIVNVGHFKGYELPTEYFLGLAYDSTRFTNNNINDYTRQWAARQFGPAYADQIADILEKYTKYNGRRKPELVDAATYSITDYHEADTVVADYKALAAQAQAINEKLPAELRDAFYQLVLFPTLACAQVNEMYVAAAKNTLYAQQGRASANDFADQTKTLFKADTDLMTTYNTTFANGKWNHFMDQSHIGYTSWQDPPQNTINAIRLTQVTPAVPASMAIALDGWAASWPAPLPPTPAAAETAPAPAQTPGARGGFGARGGRGRGGSPAMAPTASNPPTTPTLPTFDVFNKQTHYIDIFNRGQTPFDFTATASAPWLLLSTTQGHIEKEQRLQVSIDWSKAPTGKTSGTLKITAPSAGPDQIINIEALNPTALTPATLDGFIESEGFVSIEAEHFTKNIPAPEARWAKIDDYGRTLSAMSIQPMTAPSITTPTPQNSPHLEYKMYLFTPPATGPISVNAYLAPTLNFVPGRGLRYAISFDDETPQIITAVPANFSTQNGNADWEKTVKDSIRITTSKHTLPPIPGYHTLKIWMVDPGIVLEKLVVDLGGEKPTYLGPPESFHHP